MEKNAGIISSSKTKLKAVPISAVRLREGFWKKRMDLNHSRGIPRLLEHLVSHGVVENFKRVSGHSNAERQGPVFSDSDLYKWMEGASLDLQTYNDPELKDKLNKIVDEVVAAQGEDGYLNTFFQDDLFDQRFRNLSDEHELYCAGHLFQAAVAHYRATGEDKLLIAACRYADYLVSEFLEKGREGADGHPEVELALVELYRTTGKKDYLDLAEHFLSFFLFTETQRLGDSPARIKIRHTEHAVRSLYLSCGGADYFAETSDPEYGTAAERLWDDLVSSKVYITGGVGARYQGEAIGESYELPNRRAYAETCAAIAYAMFSYRMLSATGKAKYADEMERALYNGILSGVSLDGVAYFYPNPLTVFGPYQRQEWFGCTCCPTNMVRTLASIPGYMYSTSDEGIWINLYDNSEVSYELPDGTPFTLCVNTNYPWDGKIAITLEIDQPKQFTVFLRRPAWAEQPSIAASGTDSSNTIISETADGYIGIHKTWQSGDKITAEFTMPAKLMVADPRLHEDYGLVAVQRGPVVYCAESTDNPEVSIMDLQLNSGEFASVFKNDLLGGVVVLKGQGLTPIDAFADRGPLYRPMETLLRTGLRSKSVTLIPYYAWANRGISQMTVWIPWRGCQSSTMK